MESFERDVLDCGVPLGDARDVGKRYARALRTHAYVDWVELYVGVFATLLRKAHRTRIADDGAARRLLLLIEDDLGMQLFDAQARRRVQGALLRRAA